MRVAVVGAGAGGLCSLRWLKSESKITEIVAYELSGAIGGVWKYTNDTTTDEYGAPVLSSMYQNLRTNIPRQTMEFLGYPRGNDTPSFTSHAEVLQYIEDFANKEGLMEYIKFHCYVTKVERLTSVWKLSYRDMVSQTEETRDFDAIFVCAGYSSEPIYPIIHGAENFQGIKTHSHFYRKPEEYIDKTIIVVGGGPSGEDISVDLVKYAKKVIWSHHAKHQPLTTYPASIIMKTDIKEIKETSVVFEDGTESKADGIMYCTGYKYHYPFLDKSCGLQVSDYRIQPLYQHCININQPTMFVLGLLKQALLFYVVDLQARYCVKALTDGFKLPSQDTMSKTMSKQDETLLCLNGMRTKDYHVMRFRELDYYNELSSEAGVDGVKPVVVEMFKDDLRSKLTDASRYRDYIYRVIDDRTFAKRLPENEQEEVILAGSIPYATAHKSC